MNKIFIVGIGGFIGSIMRYLISMTVNHWTQSVHFPYGILTVNMIGCLLIGICSQIDESFHLFSINAHLLLFTGIFGGFTTYSSFSNDTINLMVKNIHYAFINVSVHIVFGLLSVWIGRMIVCLFINKQFN